MKRDRIFYMVDIDCEVLVEAMSRKELLDLLDEYVENVKWLDEAGENPYCEFVGVSSDSFEILYEDGSRDYIGVKHDGHKIKRQHIASIVNKNCATYCVFGNFEINEYGIVDAAFDEKVARENIAEIKKHFEKNV